MKTFQNLLISVLVSTLLVLLAAFGIWGAVCFLAWEPMNVQEFPEVAFVYLRLGVFFGVLWWLTEALERL